MQKAYMNADSFVPNFLLSYFGLHINYGKQILAAVAQRKPLVCSFSDYFPILFRKNIMQKYGRMLLTRKRAQPEGGAVIPL